MVIQTASSLNESLALNLITALGKQWGVTGEETYFIHVSAFFTSLSPWWLLTAKQTSALSAFYPSTGWPAEAIKDTGPIFDLEKKLDSFAIRKVTNLLPIKTLVLKMRLLTKADGRGGY
jgi:hypothetical protein